MDDLISRQDALTEIRKDGKWLEEQGVTSMTTNEREMRDTFILREMPSAQEKGHWRNYEGTLTCSVCETEFDNGIMEYCGDDVPMFCPNCGADMRGEDDG